MPFRRQFCIAFYDQKIILVGGIDEHFAGTRNTFVYEIKTKTLSAFRNLHQERSDAGIVKSGEELYVIGGSDRGFGKLRYLKSAERLCLGPNNSNWEQMKPMSQERGAPGVVATNNRIYVIGGFTTSCEYFDIKDNEWFPALTLPDRYRFSGMHAVLINKNIYAFPRTDPSDMVILDLKTNAVHYPPGLGQIPDTVVGCGTMNGEIWAVNQQGEIFCFNPSRLWWMKGDMPSSREPFSFAMDARIITKNELDDLSSY